MDYQLNPHKHIPPLAPNLSFDGNTSRHGLGALLRHDAFRGQSFTQTISSMGTTAGHFADDFRKAASPFD